MIFLGLLPLTILVSLNCCIYWAVRRARIERLGRTERTEEERKPRRSFLREAVNRYRGVPTAEIELREQASQQDLGQVRFSLSTFTQQRELFFCMNYSAGNKSSQRSRKKRQEEDYQV